LGGDHEVGNVIGAVVKPEEVDTKGKLLPIISRISSCDKTVIHKGHVVEECISLDVKGS
jgi:hypothetical protein